MQKFRFALLSHVLPPSPSGQASILYRILREIDPASYYLIAHESHMPAEPRTGSSFLLPAQHYQVKSEKLSYWIGKLRLSLIRDLMNILVQVPMRAMAIFRILRRNPTMALIASSGDIVDLPAGFLASRIARTSFFAYIFDDYVYQWTGFNRRIARFVSPVIFRNSNGVIGPNEFICEEYHRRYGVKTFLIRNPCSSKVLDRPAYQRWPLAEDLVKIVYTGAVYHANSDCFRNLLQAVEILRSYDIQLHIFTAQTIEQVEAQGVKGKNAYIHSHLPYNDVLEQQRQADILFLPLTFEASISEVIRTAAPGKMGEYLASQRPVLAHVPRGSFVSYYFNKYQCGAIADENDASKLAAVIEKLITDSDYRLRLTGNARRQAILDFSADSARKQLMELLPGH